MYLFLYYVVFILCAVWKTHGRDNDCIYEENIEETEEVMMRTEGNVKIGKVEEEGKLFRIHIELRKDKNDPVKNIRRWQLVGDVF